MDDVYGDLDNYNEVNVISELRNENMVLKTKLEECTIIMENLQKDYDRVSSEFKRLEINYSSLLKTAKAEIERKTQIITNLNVEKDIMVLNSIQNRGFRYRRNMVVDKNSQYSRPTDSDWSSSKRKDETVEFKHRTLSDIKGQEEKRMSSEDTTISNNTGSIHRLPYSDTKPAHCLSSSKENSQASKESDALRTEAKPSSIRNRRKSMPASNPAQLSSEDVSEEISHRDSTKDDIRTQSRDYDRHEYKSSSRRRPHESERYYKRDRYDLSRCRRPPSSDRSKERFRSTRHSEDGYYRHDLRHKTSASPPPSNYHHRSSRDMRPYKHNEYELSSNRYEKVPVKHKLDECDAPSSKRARTEERPHSDDLRRPMDKHANPNIENRPKLSCQSPDFMLPDNLVTQPVKEIGLHAAEDTLDDPRKLSNKYISNNEKNILFAATGIKVDIVPLKKTDWGIPDVPNALKSIKQNDHYDKNIYMSINDPVSNMSVESGELSDSELSNALSQISSVNSDPKQTFEGKYTEGKKLDPIVVPDCMSYLREGSQSQQDLEIHVKKQAPPLTKYRISKIKPAKIKDNNTDSKSTNIKTTKCAPANAPTNIKKEHKPLKPIKNHQLNLQDSKAMVENDLELSDDASEDIEIPEINKDDKKQAENSSQELSKHKKEDHKIQHCSSSKRSSQETVKSKTDEKEKSKYNEAESDTKLIKSKAQDKPAQERSKDFSKCNNENNASNIVENCNLKDSKSNKSSKKAEKHSSKKSDSKSKTKTKTHSSNDSNSELLSNEKVKTHDSSHSNSDKGNTASNTLETFNTTEDSHRTSIEDKVDTKETHDPKESSSKCTKSKASNKSETNVTKSSNKTDEKKKLKKDKLKQIQSLFGDSSLISPEDLGITTEETQNPGPVNYAPICEDAKDSSDIFADKFEGEANPTNSILSASVDHVASETDLSKTPDNEIKENPLEEVYKNIVEADKETDVVKTIIISTGVQPDVLDRPLISALTTEAKVDSDPKQKEMFAKVTNQEASTLKAIATSTPHKNVLQICKAGPKLARSPNDSKDTSNNNIPENNSESEQKEKDAPDVRIFITRKRKVIKTSEKSATPSKT